MTTPTNRVVIAVDNDGNTSVREPGIPDVLLTHLAHLLAEDAQIKIVTQNAVRPELFDIRFRDGKSIRVNANELKRRYATKGTWPTPGPFLGDQALTEMALDDALEELRLATLEFQRWNDEPSEMRMRIAQDTVGRLAAFA